MNAEVVGLPFARARHKRSYAVIPALLMQCEQHGNQAALLAARRDFVDEPLLQQKFRPLESLGEGLAHGLFNDARSGKTDKRARVQPE